ncbi:hypothetical protein PINS_up010619 [Pythium insidiosum]|nr:hypothetical protein PINS_up010619 [Pythium insidiosum]
MRFQDANVLTPEQSSAVDVKKQVTSNRFSIGDYVFDGKWTDKAGNQHVCKLSKSIHANGTLDATMAVKPADPRERDDDIYECSGTWVDKKITFELPYASGEYRHEGRLQGNLLVGTWSKLLEGDETFNDTKAGHFEYQLLSRPASVASMNRPATYFLEGAATSDTGIEYESSVNLTLSSDGLVVGESVEKYIDSQRCPLHGKWTNQGIEYTLSYSGVNYTYAGKMDDRLHFVGHWEIEKDELKHNGNSRGRFDFVVSEVVDESNGDAETASLPASDATESNDVKRELDPLPLNEFSVGEFVFDGEAIGDNEVVYKSVLTLKLAEDQTLTGTSTEKSVAPQVCQLQGRWSEHEVTYNLSYTDGCTATYTYRGKIEDHKLVGRWENDDVASRQSSAETGQLAFSLTRKEDLVSVNE